MKEGILFEEMIEFSRDGEWGEEEKFDDSVKVNVVRGTDFEDVREGTLEDVPTRFIAKRFAEYKTLQPWDILIEVAGGTKDQPTGRTVLITPRLLQHSSLPLTCASFARFIRIDDEVVDPRYLFWHLQWMYKTRRLKKYNTQHTGVSRFQWTTFIEEEKLRIPARQTQLRIADILGAYDDLIANNRRRIKLLEEIATTIFQKWFMHFRFPGHTEVEMRETEIGEVPESWDVVTVPEAIEVNPRIPIPDGEKHYVPMANVSEDSMVVTHAEMRDQRRGRKFQNGDTLFARITPSLENGKTGFVQFLPSDDDVGVGSGELIGLRSKTLCPEYVYLLARTERFRQNAIKSMTGSSGRQRVQLDCFDNFPIVQPDPDTIDRFERTVRPMFKSVQNLVERNQTLRETRDLLLPRLVTGEIEIATTTTVA